MRTVEVGPDILGDIYAAEGSEPWCVAMRNEIQRLLDQYKWDHHGLQQCLGSFIEHEGWKRLKDKNDQPFDSFTAFCKAPLQYGLQRSQQEIDQLLKEGLGKSAQQLAEEQEQKWKQGEGLKTRQEAGAKGGRKKKAASKRRSYGDTAGYLTARIARDRPDVLERMKAGEFKSVRQTAIVAGIVKVKTPLEWLHHWWRRASKAEHEAASEFKAVAANQFGIVVKPELLQLTSTKHF